MDMVIFLGACSLWHCFNHLTLCKSHVSLLSRKFEGLPLSLGGAVFTESERSKTAIPMIMETLKGHISVIKTFRKPTRLMAHYGIQHWSMLTAPQQYLPSFPLLIFFFFGAFLEPLQPKPGNSMAEHRFVPEDPAAKLAKLSCDTGCDIIKFG